MSKQLTIRRLFRTLRSGDDEVIEFLAGVNVIVGPQNSGKSTWLRMLDYLMGDTESAAEKFDELIVRRYQAVSAEFQFGDEIAVISRRWNEDGRRAQMSLNGEPFTIGAVQPFFLERLNIPLLRYPQGDVLASNRTWPTLGWRSLLRHIYRRQDFWSDLVPQQPESEQHACILQFVGIAEHLFGDELANLVDKQKELTRLEARKDFYSEMMQQLAPEILGEGSLSVAVTIDSIEAAPGKMEDEIAELVRQRGACLADLRDQSEFSGGDLRR